MGMSFPKPDEQSKAFFDSLVPDDPQVQSRPMSFAWASGLPPKKK